MLKIKIITSLIFLCIIIVGGFMLWNSYSQKQQATSSVVESIRALNRWETASYSVDTVIDKGTGGNKIQQLLFADKILLVAHGEAVGGFDLASLSTDAVNIQGTNITVTLPKPQLLYTKLDNDKTKVYDHQQGLLVLQPDITLESQARSAAESAIQTSACTEGLLTTASDTARKELTILLKGLHFTTITLIIPTGSC